MQGQLQLVRKFQPFFKKQDSPIVLHALMASRLKDCDRALTEDRSEVAASSELDNFLGLGL